MPTCTLEDPVCADVALVEIFAAVSSASADELLYKMNSSFSGVCLGCYRRERKEVMRAELVFICCVSLEVQFSTFNKYVYVISIKKRKTSQTGVEECMKSHVCETVLILGTRICRLA